MSEHRQKRALDHRKAGAYWLAGILMLVLASTASTGSESRGTHGNVLLCHHSLSTEVEVEV
jgi:hypothetical protein